ncbi:MAG: hypothetical protein IPJ34_16295 [Myxococcales bacterium]|nr:hypothetical protein [Myxococcales bacterium]
MTARVPSALALLLALGALAGACSKKDEAIEETDEGKGKKPKPPKKTPKTREPANHRAAHAECPRTTPSKPIGTYGPVMIQLGAPCTTNADCKDGKNGRCAADLHCSYDSCYADEDCGKAGVCVCNQRGKFGWSCRMGGCSIDSDCGPGNYCSPSYGETCGSFGGVVGWYCHKAEDRADDDCVDDDDCAKQPGGYCAWNQKSGHWRCGYGHCVG